MGMLLWQAKEVGDNEADTVCYRHGPPDVSMHIQAHTHNPEEPLRNKTFLSFNTHEQCLFHSDHNILLNIATTNLSAFSATFEWNKSTRMVRSIDLQPPNITIFSERRNQEA